MSPQAWQPNHKERHDRSTCRFGPGQAEPARNPSRSISLLSGVGDEPEHGRPLCSRPDIRSDSRGAQAARLLITTLQARHDAPRPAGPRFALCTTSTKAASTACRYRQGTRLWRRPPASRGSACHVTRPCLSRHTSEATGNPRLARQAPGAGCHWEARHAAHSVASTSARARPLCPDRRLSPSAAQPPPPPQHCRECAREARARESTRAPSCCIRACNPSASVRLASYSLLTRP